MAFLRGKTPISFLQELCTKRNITPQYDLIANEGAVHEPTFVYKVTAGEYTGTGHGTSKKKSRQQAALSVLNQMMGIPAEEAETSGEYPAPGSGDDAGNPVGELQEMTQKQMWAPPVYEFTNEQGPPHAREFVCTVKLGRLQEQGSGKSKKIAKRVGAETMIAMLKTALANPSTAAELREANQAQPEMMASDGALAYAELKGSTGARVPTLTPQTSQKITAFYQGLKSKTGNKLNHLQAVSLAASTNYCQMLQDISEEQRFEVTYVDIPELSKTGASQCLVQLSSMPVAVCHGTALSKDAARAAAAHNALHYLKIMTKKA